MCCLNQTLVSTIKGPQVFYFDLENYKTKLEYLRSERPSQVCQQTLLKIWL